MERGNFVTEHYFNSRQAVDARLDYALEWYEELNANLTEPSTERTTENIAELQEQRQIALREMGMLAARLTQFQSVIEITDEELDVMLNSCEFEEVK